MPIPAKTGDGSRGKLSFATTNSKMVEPKAIEASGKASKFKEGQDTEANSHERQRELLLMRRRGNSSGSKPASKAQLASEKAGDSGISSALSTNHSNPADAKVKSLNRIR